LVTLLSVSHSLSLERVSELFNDLFGYAINEQTVLSILERGFDCAEPLVDYIKAQVQAAPVAHFDETGVRAAGQLHWAHTASTADYTYLFVHPKRGLEALGATESALTGYRGIAVHDFWKPYFSFNDLSHALCGSHLLRELNALIENGSHWAEAMRQQLLALHDRGRPIVPIAQTDLRVRYQSILDQANAEEPPPPGQPAGPPQKQQGPQFIQALQRL
jgi:transposase